MDWDELRYLLALSRFATLGQAAQHLGVNYTTVSRRLNALQEKAGVRLIEKKGRVYELTEAGVYAVKTAEAMEINAQNLERRWFGHDTRMVGTIRVTTLDVLGQLYINAFAEFSARFPGIDLEINSQSRTLSLAQRQADVAIRVSGAPPENLVGRRIARLNYFIYGARALVKDIKPDTPLSHYPWLAWHKAAGARVTQNWMEEHVPDARISARVDSSLMMLSLLRKGVGLAFAPAIIAEQFPELIAIQQAPKSFDTDVWLLTHEELRNAARIRALMDHMAHAKMSWV